mgnify:CR=1 FL=1
MEREAVITQQVIQALKKEISQERLYRILSTVSRHHRIQTTRSYYRAAVDCAQLLHEYGIDARVIPYEMKEKTFAGSYRLFPEWNCKDGWCQVIEPKQLKLADFKEDPIQVITQSIAWKDPHRPLEIIDMDKGSDPSNYKDVDFKDKLLFTHEQVKRYRWAFQKGALGIISDYLNETNFFRSPQDVPDVRNYTGFWWDYSEEETKGFGFVISSRLSLQLKALCQLQKERFAQGKADSPYPKALAYMDTKIEDGQIEVVEAALPGKSKETVLITAHLCHPYASANDNASGVSGALETLIAIKRLLDQGKLSPLEKTIRVLLIPEFTGTYHYVHDKKDLSAYCAAINLDMIGAKQEGITGPITLTHLPYASPSIAGELASLLLEEVKQEPSCKEDILLQNVLTKEEEFGLGSDHFILSDPQVDIPCVMLGQMPDLYYHTSGDTLQRMDMAVLKYSTLVAASYVYLLSNMDKETAAAVYTHQCTHLMKQIEEKKRKAYREKHDEDLFKKELAVLKEFHLACAKDMLHYCETIRLEKQYARIESLLPQDMLSNSTGTTIYKRKCNDPIESLRSLFLENKEKLAWIDAYDEEFKENKDKLLCEVLCLYYIDGQRSEGEIIDRVEGESGIRCADMLMCYLRLLERLGCIQKISE